MGLGKFLGLPIMASHAILWSDERRDEKSLVVVGVRFALLSPVAFDAADPLRRMAADFPIVDASDGDVLGHMAVDAFLVFSRDKRPEAAASPLFDLDIADARECEKEDQAEPADHIAGEVFLAVARTGRVVLTIIRLSIALVHVTSL